MKPTPKTIVNLLGRSLVATAALLTISCSPSIDMPKGTSKGYSSARLVHRGSQSPAITDATEKQEPGMTASHEDYFGYGRNAAEISDIAHIRGSLENKRPDRIQPHRQSSFGRWRYSSQARC